MIVVKTPIELLDDRVLVQPTVAPERTEAGIYVPSQSQPKPSRGLVVAVGPGKYSDAIGGRIPVDVEVGDLITFPAFTGYDLEIEGTTYRVLTAAEIIGILPPLNPGAP